MQVQHGLPLSLIHEDTNPEFTSTVCSFLVQLMYTFVKLEKKNIECTLLVFVMQLERYNILQEYMCLTL